MIQCNMWFSLRQRKVVQEAAAEIGITSSEAIRDRSKRRRLAELVNSRLPHLEHLPPKESC